VAVKKIVNETPLVTGWTMALRPDGRELVVVVAKGTYVLVDRQAATDEPTLADKQVPLLDADEFGDDPAKNAPRRENDFAPIKPECDVLLVGAAYAAHGKPAKAIGVGLRVGSVSKSFQVTGRRKWEVSVTGNVSPGEPEPVTGQPISYDVAFGGTEIDPNKPDRIETYLENPVGRGFRKRKVDLWGQPMPVTEEIGVPIRDPKKSYRPMAFGPLGRNWKPRMDYVGTYDQKWMDDVAPMLPTDFNPLHFQAAPPDQRMPYPRGGEPIRLVNLVPPAISSDARAQNALPKQSVGMVFIPFREDPIWMVANLDTVLIEPDENRFTCTWRASHAVTRDTFEINEVVVYFREPHSEARVRARIAGKEYYAGLGELTRARRGGGR
jgi:hypothetical protein